MQFVLSERERLMAVGVQVDILIVRVTKIYEFVLALQLPETRIFFYDSDFKVKPNHLWRVFRERRQLRTFFAQYLPEGRYQVLHYFANAHDWITGGILAKADGSVQKKFRPVEVLDTATTTDQTGKETLKEKFQLTTLKAISGVRFQVRMLMSGTRLYYFPYQKYGVESEPVSILPNAIKPYRKAYGTGEKALLILDSHDDFFFSNYSKVIGSLIKKWKFEGYSIVVKGHPRLPLSACLKQLSDVVIDPALPSEFIDPKSFSFVVGSTSSGLASFAREEEVAAYTIVDQLEFVDESRRGTTLELLDKYSESKIKEWLSSGKKI